MEDDPLICEAEQVQSRLEFARFVELLRDDLERNRDSWQNIELDAFLSAFSGFLEASPLFYSTWKIGINAEEPSWRLFADAFLAARVRD